MTDLVTATPLAIAGGKYFYTMSTGLTSTAKLQIQVDGKPFQDITGISIGASAAQTGEIGLPSSTVQSILTGSGILSLIKVKD